MLPLLPVFFVLADGSNTALDPTNPAFWASLGIGGVLVLAFVRGWIVPGYVLDRAEKRIEQQAARIDKLTDVFEHDMLPALTKSTDAVSKSAEANERVHDLIVRLTDDAPPRRR